MRGKVLWFNEAKRFGFIRPDDGDGRDMFVHLTEVERAGLSRLVPDDVVEYAVGSDRTGRPTAVDLRMVREAE